MKPLPFQSHRWYNPAMGSLIGLWLWRVGVTAVLLPLIFIYSQGWRQQPPEERPYRALCLFSASILLLFLILVTPLHQLASRYFFARTAQHLLLIAWVPALLMASNPWPVLVAGLTPSIKERLYSWQRPSPQWHTPLRFLTSPGTVWLMLICSFWLWYDPILHEATLTYPWLRALEITMLFFPALLYWWHITRAAPYLHNELSLMGRIAFTVAATMPIKIVGLILLFVPETIYLYPQPLISGFIFDGESLGGVMIWVLGGVVYSWTAVYLMREWLSDEDEKPGLPGSLWDTEEAMLAPGLRSNKGV